MLAGWLSAAIGSAVTLGPRQTATFRSSVETVAVYATVRAQNGSYLTTLTADDFELFDSGKRQQIAVFSNDIQPTTIALLLDQSESLSTRSAAVRSAALSFVHDLLPDDRASISTLFWDCQAMTSDKDALLRALDDVNFPLDTGSPIWTAVDRVASSLGPEPGRRAVLLFSDGMNQGSVIASRLFDGRRGGPCRLADGVSTTMEEASDHASRDGLALYTISVDSSQGTNKSDLDWVAKQTGGRSYALHQDTDLRPAFLSVLEELHHQYLLGFVPAAFDGKIHRLEVRVRQPGAVVRARQEYVAERVDTTVKSGDRDKVPLSRRTVPITESETELAIQSGTAGAKLQATCSLEIPWLDNESVEIRVTAEGPIGRIMRASREARAKGQQFTATQITSEMRSSNVLVSVEGRMLPSLIRLQDSSARRLIVNAIAAPAQVSTSVSTRGAALAQFDLAQFYSLTGQIRAVLTYFDGDQTCSFRAVDALAIR